MKTNLWLLGLASAVLAAGCKSKDDADGAKAAVSSGERPSALVSTDDDDGDDDGAEERIAVSDVPAAVVQAAQAAVPGFVIQAAEKEVENGQVVYSLEGTVDGDPCEVEVTSGGTVTEIEHGDDDGDDDD